MEMALFYFQLHPGAPAEGSEWGGQNVTSDFKGVGVATVVAKHSIYQGAA